MVDVKGPLAAEMTTGWMGALSRGVLSLRLVAVNFTILGWLLTGATWPQVAMTLVVGALSVLMITRWSVTVRLIVRWPVLLVLDGLLALGFGLLTSPSLAFLYYLLSVSMLAGMSMRAGGVLGISGLTSFGAFFLIAFDPTIGVDVERVGTISLIGLFPMSALLTRSMLGSVRHRLVQAKAEEVEASRRGAEQERRRIALDLHDSLGKTLEGVSFSVAALDSRMSAEHPARVLVGQIEQDMRHAAGQARMLMLELRTHPEDGLTDAVQGYAARWSERTGIEVQLQVERITALPGDLSHAVLAMVTEGLANVECHAGASAVRLSVSRHDEVAGRTATGQTLVLCLQDDGCGLSATTDLDALTGRGHLGLAGMADRASSLGGRLDIAPAASGGTSLTITLPLARGGVVPAPRPSILSAPNEVVVRHHDVEVSS